MLTPSLRKVGVGGASRSGGWITPVQQPASLFRGILRADKSCSRVLCLHVPPPVLRLIFVWLWDCYYLFHLCVVPKVLDVNFSLGVQTDLFYEWLDSPGSYTLILDACFLGIRYMAWSLSFSGFPQEDGGHHVMKCGKSSSPGLAGHIDLVLEPESHWCWHRLPLEIVPLTIRGWFPLCLQIHTSFSDCLSHFYFMLIRNSNPHVIFGAEIVIAVSQDQLAGLGFARLGC